MVTQTPDTRFDLAMRRDYRFVSISGSYVAFLGTMLRSYVWIADDSLRMCQSAHYVRWHTYRGYRGFLRSIRSIGRKLDS